MTSRELVWAVAVSACATPETRDVSEANRRYELEAERTARRCWDGDAHACYERSRLHSGTGDMHCWAAVLHHACGLGDRQSCAELLRYWPARAKDSVSSWGERDCLDHPNPERKAALQLAHRCRGGDAVACFERGALQHQHGDRACYVVLLDHACKLELPAACDELERERDGDDDNDDRVGITSSDCLSPYR